ncbi:protein-disulfide reductase DsbD domain-containing protein [Oceanibium sediminis]|uniref:protein-disulfide reductase DsbD domain-containing protein n=1 Tax=Oceanibium sediminis TaxID=2026339 RepID=UPI001300AF2B|nr:protein-disulfide reductase DsbD domain-containing protein [Oceanibium sediminis]
MSNPRSLPPILAVLVALSAQPAVSQEMAQVRLLPGWVTESGSRMIGVEIALEPGWKTYWRAPQGNGIPPTFNTAGSTNLAGAEVHWPRPVVFETYGISSIGYEDHVIFPMELMPEVADAPISLTLELFFGVCQDVCIPAERSLSLEVPARIDGASHSGVIRASYDSRGVPGAEAGVTGYACAISGTGGTRAVDMTVRFAVAPPQLQTVVLESGSDLVWMTLDSVSASGPLLALSGEAVHAGGAEGALDPERMRLSLIGDGPVIELTGCPPA